MNIDWSIEQDLAFFFKEYAQNIYTSVMHMQLMAMPAVGRLLAR